MCCPCGFLCCGSDEFGGCGCDDCPDPRCHDRHTDDSPRPAPLNDNEPVDMPAPIAASARVAARFRCVEIA